jgi:signal transduction histidine kinase
LANFRYIKVKEIIDKLAVDSNKWVKETAERTRRKLKISASTDKRDRKYDYVLGLIRRLKKKYPEELNDEILDDILKSVLEVGERYYEELASDAAHQINTALTALDHASEELQAKLPKRGKSKKEVEELFSNFLEQKEYLKKIVRDLRIYSEPYDTNFTSERLDSILEEALVRAKNKV